MDDKRRELETCKQAYEQPHMSERQIEAMRRKIEEAKLDNRREKKKKLMGLIRSSVSCSSTPSQSLALRAFSDPALENQKKDFRKLLSKTTDFSFPIMCNLFSSPCVYFVFIL